MKLFRILALALSATVLAAAPVFAQGAPGKKKIAITKISATDALRTRMSKQGVGLSLDSVLQALDSQVYDSVLNTRTDSSDTMRTPSSSPPPARAA